MTVIRHNSISGIVSITAAAGSNLSFYDSTGATLSLDTGDINAGVITATTANFTNATVTGDLTVQGTTTTLDTTVTEVDKLEVGANNTTVGVAITQSGTGDILRLYDGATEVFSVIDGGDITVGNSGFFYDYSTSKLGVGLDTPGSTRLHVKGHSSLNNSLLVDVNTGDSTLGFAENGTEKWRIENVTSADALRFYDVTNTAERLRINSSGNVGIGTDNPQQELHINSSGGGYAMITTINTGSNAGILFGDYDDNDIGSVIYENANDALTFTTNTQERLRIDSSGRLGLNSNLSGASAYNRVVVNSPDNSCWVSLQSAQTGSTINSDGLDIGLNGSNQGHVWLRENADLVIATNNTERLRILSSGGLTFNGDTATANALDDYEEGTWTPTLTNSSGTTITATVQTGRYVRIGRLITIYTYIWNVTGSFQTITGFPAALTSNGNHQAVGNIVSAGGGNNTAPNGGGPPVILLTQGNTQLKMQSNYFSPSQNIWMTITYEGA